MSYSDQTDLTNAKAEKIIQQLTGGVGTIVVSKVTAAIAFADAKIDSYIGGRYSVPITGTVPGSIQGYSTTIAIYYLYGRQHSYPQDVKDDYDAVILELKDIKKGTLSVPGLIASRGSKVIQPFADDDLGGYDTVEDNAFNMDVLED